MAKIFEYGKFPDGHTPAVFTEGNNYLDTGNATETRAQFSYPLEEVENFLNETTSVDNENNPIQLRLNEDTILQYKEKGSEEWLDTASSGHKIFYKDEEGTQHQLENKPKLVFDNVSGYNEGDETHIECLVGPQGEQGETGVSVVNITEIPSPVSGGENTLYFKMSDGFVYEAKVKNGKDGSKGEKGDGGEDGFTPKVTLTSYENGVQISVLNKEGSTSATVLNGTDGSDFKIKDIYRTLESLKRDYPEGSSHPEREGFAFFVGEVGNRNPIYFWNERIYEWVNIGYLQGPQGVQGERGETGPTGPQGEPGVDGVTPLRGIDYWTEEDKSEIVNDVKVEIAPTLASKLSPDLSNINTAGENKIREIASGAESGGNVSQDATETSGLSKDKPSVPLKYKDASGVNHYEYPLTTTDQVIDGTARLNTTMVKTALSGDEGTLNINSTDFYPLTKVGKIIKSDGTRLSEDDFGGGGKMFIDTSVDLGSGQLTPNVNKSFGADAFVIFIGRSDSLFINDLKVFEISGSSTVGTLCFFLKAGETIKYTSSTTTNPREYRAFGMKG